jgi:protein involved in polysaccharide export with SLBB domain
VLLPGEHLRLFVAEDASFDGVYQIRLRGYLAPPSDGAGAGPGGRGAQVRRVGGYIILPTVGGVLVSGMTLPDAEKAVGAAIEAARLLAHATVTLKRVPGPVRLNGQIVAADPPSVYVTGRVMHPRRFSVGPDDTITVQAAIAGAGGFAKFADLDKIYVLRVTPGGGLVKIPVDMRAIQNGVARGIPLGPQDILVVPEKFYID